MKSKTSFFNGTLLKKNVTRNLPLWVLYTVFLVTALLLPILSENYGGQARANVVLEVVNSWASIYGQLVTMVYSVICAACCFSYLHKTRSAYMLHALPITRTTMFATNYVSGLLFCLVPNLVITALSSLICSNGSCTEMLFQLLGILTLETLFFYGLAVFCMMLCGKTVSGTIIYFLLNFLAVIVGYLTTLLVQPMIYGLRDGGDWFVSFSPVWKLLMINNAISYAGYDAQNQIWQYLFIIAAVGVVLSAVSYLMYRVRRLESAGDLVAYKAAKPVAKYALTYLGSLCLGLLISDILFGYQTYSQKLPGVIVCLIFGGFIGYFGAEMLLKKTLRVFRSKAILGFAIYTVLLAICLIGIRADWFGTIRYVPQTEEIVSVCMDTGNNDTIELTDTSDIERVRRMHGDLTTGEGREEYPSVYLNITYTLKNGRTVSRRYGTTSYWVRGTSDAAKILMDFYQRPDLIQTSYDALNVAQSAVRISVKDTEQLLSSTQAAQLYDAMCADIQEGKLGLYGQIFDWSIEYYISVTNGNSYTMVYIPNTATNTIKFIQTIY